jgi:hypothetical protein
MTATTNLRSLLRTIGFVVLVTGCAAPLTTRGEALPSQQPSGLEPTATPEVDSPSAEPTSGASPDGITQVTIQLTLNGTVPSDAVFALQTSFVPPGGQGSGGAIYLCSYYGGWPVCESGHTYSESYEFPTGSEVTFRVWRELDADGTAEDVESGELTLDDDDRVVTIEYDF